jgi:hypothetical protein
MYIAGHVDGTLGAAQTVAISVAGDPFPHIVAL